jgi:hypothetical protein
VGELSIADAADAEDKSEQCAVLVERAGGEAAHVLHDMEERGGNDVGLIPAPDASLQFDAGPSVLDGGERANADRGAADGACDRVRLGGGRERQMINHAAGG